MRDRSTLLSPFDLCLHAIAENNVEKLKRLLEANEGILDQQDGSGNTLLHCAVRDNDQWKDSCILLLFRKEVNLDRINNAGQTPSHIAAGKSGRSDIISELARRGANLKMQDNEGNTVFHIFARNENKLASFIEKHIREDTVNLQNTLGKTVLHYAIEKNFSKWDTYFGSIKALVEIGADLRIKDNNGKTPRDIFESSRAVQENYTPSKMGQTLEFLKKVEDRSILPTDVLNEGTQAEANHNTAIEGRGLDFLREPAATATVTSLFLDNSTSNEPHLTFGGNTSATIDPQQVPSMDANSSPTFQTNIVQNNYNPYVTVNMNSNYQQVPQTATNPAPAFNIGMGQNSYNSYPQQISQTATNPAPAFNIGMGQNSYNSYSQQISQTATNPAPTFNMGMGQNNYNPYSQQISQTATDLTPAFDMGMGQNNYNPYSQQMSQTATDLAPTFQTNTGQYGYNNPSFSVNINPNFQQMPPVTVNPYPQQMSQTATNPAPAFNMGMGQNNYNPYLQQMSQTATNLTPTFQTNIVQNSSYPVVENQAHVSLQSGLVGNDSAFFNDCISAIQNQDLERLETLFNSQTPNIDRTDTKGRTLLHHAAQRSSIRIIKYLLTCGFNVKVKDIEGKTPLHYAASRFYDFLYYPQIVHVLIEKGSDMNALDRNGNPPLFHAIKKNNKIETLEYFREQRANIGATNNNGETLLHYILRERGYRSSELILYIIDKEYTDIKAVDKEGSTLFHYALKELTPEHLNGQLSLIRKLLTKGIDTNVKDNEEKAALDYVEISLRGKVKEIIDEHERTQTEGHPNANTAVYDVDYSYEPPTTNIETSLLLTNPTSNNEYPIPVNTRQDGYNLSVTISTDPSSSSNTYNNEAFSSINAVPSYNLTDQISPFNLCLHAIKDNNVEELKCLLEANEGILVQKDKDGNTLLHHAVEASNQWKDSSVSLIFKRGANLNIINNAGQTPSHIAAKKNSDNIANELAKNKERVNLAIQDCEGNTVFHLFAMNNDNRISFIKKHISASTVNVRNNQGRTVLHYVVTKVSTNRTEHYRFISILIERGADPRVKDVDGNKAGELLKYERSGDNRKRILKLLKESEDKLTLVADVQSERTQTEAHRDAGTAEHDVGLLYDSTTGPTMTSLFLNNSTFDEEHLTFEENTNAATDHQQMIHTNTYSIPTSDTRAGQNSSYLMSQNEASVSLQTDLTRSDVTFFNACLAAILDQELVKLETLFRSQAPAPDKRDSIGRTLLHHAAQKNNGEIIQYLLTRGFDANAKDFEGKTPLHYAASRRYKRDEYEKNIDLLIKDGSDINASDNEGNTPLFYAVEVKRSDGAVIDYFHSKGANTKATNNKGETLFHYIFKKKETYSSHTFVLHIIKEKYVNIKAKDLEGNTLFHCILDKKLRFNNPDNRLDLIHKFFESGADIDALNNKNKKAFDYVASNLRGKIQKIIDEHERTQTGAHRDAGIRNPDGDLLHALPVSNDVVNNTEESVSHASRKRQRDPLSGNTAERRVSSNDGSQDTSYVGRLNKRRSTSVSTSSSRIL